MKAKVVALAREVLDSKVPEEAKESIVAMLENWRTEYLQYFMGPEEGEYKESSKHEDQLFKEIVALLPDGKMMLLDDFRSAVIDTMDMDIRFSYKNGLHDGLVLAIELLDGRQENRWVQSKG